MLFARLFFVLKIKTVFVSGCIFVCDTRFFVVCWQDFLLFVTSDCKAEFCLNYYRFRKSTPASNTFSILRFFKE